MVKASAHKLNPAFVVILVLGFVAFIGGGSAWAAATDAALSAMTLPQAADVTCEMTFSMEGWSAIVSKAEGKGTVTCDNGQEADVVLVVSGGGFTFSKTKIDEGKGTFTKVTDISEIFGGYAQGELQTGGDDPTSQQALTKGTVKLQITAEGRGWSFGVSGGKFEIKRAET
jgi:hypothetical protein